MVGTRAQWAVFGGYFGLATILGVLGNMGVFD